MCNVSVITVTYNAEKCIEKTLISVLKQKYDDFEYIIKDGNSTDNTNNIIKNIMKEFGGRKKYKHISVSDNGIYDAMNNAVKYASGEWIIFMNAGDTFYDQNVLSDIFTIHYDKSVNVLYGHALWKLTGNRGFVQTYDVNNLVKGCSICHQAVLEKREMLIQKPFDVNLKILADREHFLQLINCGIKFQRINIIIAKEDRNGISSVNYPLFYKEETLISKKHHLNYAKKNVQIGKIKMIVKKIIPRMEEYAMIKKALKRIN